MSLSQKDPAFVEKLTNAPQKPGCYLWKNQQQEIIYVGKAKNLFKRTHQYFNKSLDFKTSKLVENIADVDFIIVSNEKEALILEQNLISKYKPKYNVLLRENKNLPYIVVTDEKYPRLLYKFLVKQDKKKYKATYGPFVTGNAYAIYDTLNRIFPFRKCSLTQTRPCMYHAINQCLCPQLNNMDPVVFEKFVQELNDFFRGNTRSVTERLTHDEQQAASNLNFELAAKYKKLHDNLNKILDEQIIDLQNTSSVDVVAFARKENVIAITIFQYLDGILKNKHEKITLIYGSTEEELVNYIFQYYSLFEFRGTKKVVVSLSLTDVQTLREKLNIEIINPTKGKLHEAMLLALQNAEDCLNKNFETLQRKTQQIISAMTEFSQLVKVDNLTNISMLDNSNLFNQNPVGVICHFTDGKLDRYLCRKYLIPQDSQNYHSDYWYTYFVVKKHFAKLKANHERLVNLFIVDGGKLQINAALKALGELEINLPVVGLVKNSFHKTEALELSDHQRVELKKNTPIYYLLCRLQEATHNYAINFFRKKNLDSFFTTFLSEIKNVGHKRIQALLEHFSTLSDLQNASLEQICQIVPYETAKEIQQKIHELFAHKSTKF